MKQAKIGMHVLSGIKLAVLNYIQTIFIISQCSILSYFRPTKEFWDFPTPKWTWPLFFLTCKSELK